MCALCGETLLLPPPLICVAVSSSDSEIQLKHQHFCEGFPDYRKSLQLCPVCESEKCYFLILFIYTIFFFESLTGGKKKKSGP